MGGWFTSRGDADDLSGWGRSLYVQRARVLASRGGLIFIGTLVATTLCLMIYGYFDARAETRRQAVPFCMGEGHPEERCQDATEVHFDVCFDTAEPRKALGRPPTREFVSCAIDGPEAYAKRLIERRAKMREQERAQQKLLHEALD